MALDTAFSTKLQQHLSDVMQHESIQGRLHFRHAAQTAMAVGAIGDLSSLYTVQPEPLSSKRADWELQQASIIQAYRHERDIRQSVLITVPVLHNATCPIHQMPASFAEQAHALGVKHGLLSEQCSLHFLPRPISFDSLAELSVCDVYHLNQALVSYLVEQNSATPVTLQKMMMAEERPERRHRRSPYRITSFLLGVATLPSADYGCHLLPQKMASAIRALDYRDWPQHQRWCEKMGHHFPQPGRQFAVGLAQFCESLELGRLAEYRLDAGSALMGLNGGREGAKLLALGPGSNETQAELLVINSDGTTVLNHMTFSLAGFSNQPLASFRQMVMEMAASQGLRWAGQLNQAHQLDMDVG